jgi:2-polyprenyl-3-methyl-5-hydroxy-6-metoxy-1,4-benzoquinol methylase
MTYQTLNTSSEPHDPWPELPETHQTDPYRANLIASLVQADPDEAICDYGCGDGTLLGILHQQGQTNLTGIDHSPEGLRRAKLKAPNATLIKADLTVPLDMHEWFAIAICSEVLEHLPNERNMHTLLNTIRNSLRHFGVVIISIPDDNICDIDPDHRRLFESGDEVILLREAGFRHVKAVRYHHSDQYPRPWMIATGVK